MLVRWMVDSRTSRSLIHFRRVRCPQRYVQQREDNQSMIRYGILGFGLHAVKRLMPGFTQAKRCTVTGLWRRDRQKAQDAIHQYKQFPLRSYDSPEALCSSSEIDAIFVASPDALHLEHVLVAVRHNKPVLC